MSEMNFKGGTKMHIPAIPTMYNGIQFRSRLEAKWACFFDLIGWSWEYEPIDLNGYIPDFVISGKRHPIYVEIKPSMDSDQLTSDCQKARLATLGKRLLMLGGCIEYQKTHSFTWEDDDGAEVVETATEYWNGHQCVRLNNCDDDYASHLIDGFGKGNPDTNEWNSDDPSAENCIVGFVYEMCIRQCAECESYFPESIGYSHCITCGLDLAFHNNGSHRDTVRRPGERRLRIKEFWKQATNTIQYRHKGRS